MQIKDHNYYSKRDNLWNEPQRLDPKKFARYSEKNIDPETTFKKNVKDLVKIEQLHKDETFQKKFTKIHKLKQDDADRNLSRKLERLIWQYQAS